MENNNIGAVVTNGRKTKCRFCGNEFFTKSVPDFINGRCDECKKKKFNFIRENNLHGKN